MKSLLRSVCLLMLVCVSGLLAQTPAAPAKSTSKVSDEETKTGWWDCTLPGGNFTVGIGKISSVSMHQYIVKSPTQSTSAVPQATRVYEVNVASDTAMVTRFYFMESASDGGALSSVKTGIDRLGDLANQAAERTGTAKYWQMVQKDYPLSTHAHTVEFRIESLDDLNKLYGSVKRSWLSGRGAKFTITNE